MIRVIVAIAVLGTGLAGAGFLVAFGFLAWYLGHPVLYTGGCS